MPAHTNRLAQEASPYLLQHAHNPVDWFAWGEEATARAKAENKPILLSVGYSACHWCHVMERESFENEAIAALMNEYFVCVKVDREERPDVDSIYMTAVQMLTGQGGWPMTVFLTPDGKPFYGGTYYPPEDRWGRPGFPRILLAVAEAWRDRRTEVEEQAHKMLDELEYENRFGDLLTPTLLTPSIFQTLFDKFAERFDATHGGFGAAPKFPQPANLDFLLRFHIRSKRMEPLAMVEKTLQRMALGGIYDQLGGGFHRYSVDEVWLVPHFEKMLYDNAQLVQTYVRAYQITQKPLYKGVAEETLEYLLREMTSEEGGFYSAQDADSEGVEGKFFVWTLKELEEVLGKRDAALFAAFYDVTEHGNWEENNILHVVKDAQTVARENALSLEETAQVLDSARLTLLQVRENRIKPGLDDKILTAWNGLALAAFAECALICERPDFRDAAIKNATFLLEKMVAPETDGFLRLYRTYRNGTAKLNAYLEDYAFFADGLLWLYEATGESRWLDAADRLAETMCHYFWDEKDGGFFAVSSDHEALIHRPKDWDDNATPSGNSVAIEVLLRLALLRGREDYREKAAQTLRIMGKVIEKRSMGFSRLLGALDFYLAAPKEIALIGDLADPATQALQRVLYESYLPNKVVAFSQNGTLTAPNAPLLEGRTLLEGKPTAYVCENFTCKQPVTTPEALRQQLKRRV